MTQYAVPISDISKASWIQLAGDGDADAFDENDEGIDSGSPDDASTAWQTDATNSVSRTIEFGLTSLSDPSSSSGHILKARVAKSSASGAQLDGVLYLYQGTTLIATSSTVTNITETWQTITLTLSSGEADSITDYTALRGRFVGTLGAGASRRARISAMEFQCPDVGGGAQTVTMDVLTLAGSVPTMTVAPGAVTPAMDVLTLAGSIPTMTVVPGAVAVALDVLSLLGAAQTLTVVATVTIGANTLTLAGSLPDLSVSPGAVVMAMDVLTLAASLQALVVAPGAVAITLDTLNLAASTPTLSVSGTLVVALNTLSLALSVPDLAVTPGGASVALDTLQLAASVPNISLAEIALAYLLHQATRARLEGQRVIQLTGQYVRRLD